MQYNYLHLLFLLSAAALNAAESAPASSSSSMGDDTPVYTVYSPNDDCLALERSRDKQNLSLSLMRKTGPCTMQKIEDNDESYHLHLFGNDIHIVRRFHAPSSEFFGQITELKKASLLVNGGYLRNMQDQDETSYRPAMRFLLLNSQRVHIDGSIAKSADSTQPQATDAPLQQLASLTAVVEQLRSQQCQQPTLIVDLQQWLINRFGQKWQDNLPIKQVRSTPERVSWLGGLIQFNSVPLDRYRELTGKELQELEQPESAITIQDEC